MIDALHSFLFSRRRRRRDLWALRLTDADLEGADPRILQGFGEPSPEPRPVRRDAPVRIVLHLHYPELWPEFQALLQAQPGTYGLIVSLTDNCAGLSGAIVRAFPGAETVVLPNLGRDVGPFFELLSRGHLDGAALLCKIHGKRSVARSRLPDVGDRWRRSALVALLGEDRFRGVTGAFRDDPTLGLVGPSHLLMPSSRMPADHPMAWGTVRREVEELERRLDVDTPRLEFFAGTMFWLSQEALTPLRRLALRQQDFVEAGAALGTLAHAGERIFVPAARSIGLAVAAVPPGPGPLELVVQDSAPASMGGRKGE